MTMENQYLKPEDLPITDAKKSPLALLAMTCSNIGADILGQGKSMLSMEKNKKGRNDDSRSDSVTSDKIQANSIDSTRSNSRGSSEGGGHKHNSGHKISFKPYEDIPKNGEQGRQNDDKRASPRGIKRRSPSPSKQTSVSKSPESKRNSSSSHPTSSSSESDHLKHLGLLSPLTHLSKTTGVCRDPFCTGCSLSHLHNSFLPPPPSSSSCCSSFPHCVHVSHLASFPHPSLSYASSMARFGNSSTRPFLCHWTAGGSYCGKSFSSCEELLQHLKTHTLSSSAVNSASTSFPGLGSFMNPHHPSSLLGRHAGLGDLRYHPYKLNGLGLRSPPTPSPLAHPASNNPFSHHHQHPSSALPSPSMTVFHPSQHPALGSFYRL